MGRGRVFSIAWVALVLGSAGPVGAQDFMQAAHLARDGAHDDDSFGVGLACDGESILVGASRETTDVGESTGAVYVYSGADFSFQQRLVASEAVEWDTFGGRVDVDGDRAIVSAPRIQGGKAYFLERIDGVWSEQQILDPSSPASGGSFGRGVALEGDTALVAAPKEDGDTGAVYVYGLVDGVWTEQQRLRASDAESGDFFGMSFALDGDTLAVAAPGNLLYPDERAPVYVFTRTGGQWAEQDSVTFQGEGGPAEGGGFGRSVALQGDTLVVGARAGMDEAANYGLQVFHRSGASWTLETTLTLPETDSMGVPVLMQGELLWTRGTTSDVRGLYQFARDGDAWSAGTRVTSLDTGALSGFGLCGGTLLLSHFGDDLAGGVNVYRAPSLDAMLPGGGASDGGDDDGGCSVGGRGQASTLGAFALGVLVLARRRGRRPA